MASYQLITEPATEPITLSEAKAWLRVTSTAEDTLITALIKTARKQVENRTQRALITQEWQLVLTSSEFNQSDLIYIGRIPLQSEPSLTVGYLTGGAYTEMYAADFEVNYQANPAIIRIINKPSVDNSINAVKITFTAGYGDTAADVPEDIKTAMKYMIGHYYENRQDVVTGTQVNEMPKASEFILEAYRSGTSFGW